MIKETSLATTGTNSVFSTGSTSQNQPTAPRNARMIPTTLTTTCMTNPAAKSVSPNAVTIGQGVGAGTMMFPGRCSCSSAAISFLMFEYFSHQVCPEQCRKLAKTQNLYSFCLRSCGPFREIADIFG